LKVATWVFLLAGKWVVQKAALKAVPWGNKTVAR
jgi:hypothetical protein